MFTGGSTFEIIKYPCICSCNNQEPEIEYVEGYEELELEDDIEDFGGLAIARSQMDDDNGKAVTRYLVSSIFSFNDDYKFSLILCLPLHAHLIFIVTCTK